jgi:hypothetical protein
MSVETPVLTVLNLGCGRRRLASDYHVQTFDAGGKPVDVPVAWWHLDANPVVKPDLVCLLGRDPIPLPDNSVNLALAMHVLEHVGRQGETEAWFYFWQELYRVMQPSGRVQFECPHHTSVWAWADPTHSRAISREAFVYLNQDGYRHGGSIPDYRPPFDFVLTDWTLKPDATNPGIHDVEGETTYCAGTLVARKPLRPYWEDAR